MKNNIDKVSFAFITIVALVLVFLGSSALVSAANIGFNERVTRYTVDTHGKYSGVITATQTIYPKTPFSGGKFSRGKYTLEFSPGLPVCLDVTYSFNNCPTNSRLDRAGISLLINGQTYLISHFAGDARGISLITLSQPIFNQILPVGTIISASNGYKVKVATISAPQGFNQVYSITLVITNAVGASETLTVNTGDAPTRVFDSFYVQASDAFYTQGANSTARIIVSSGNIALRNSMRLTNSPVYNGWNVVLDYSFMRNSPSLTSFSLTAPR
ncbi:MAG: hypothetical protein V1722_04795 [Candidatus Micrarchaeota archaeon]